MNDDPWMSSDEALERRANDLEERLDAALQALRELVSNPALWRARWVQEPVVITRARALLSDTPLPDIEVTIVTEEAREKARAIAALAPSVCPSCGSDNPRVRLWDWMSYQSDEELCPDAFHGSSAPKETPAWEPKVIGFYDTIEEAEAARDAAGGAASITALGTPKETTE